MATVSTRKSLPIIDISYNDISTLINNSKLKIGAFYRILDRPSFSTRPSAFDNGIILQALDSNILSKEGTRRMLCPYTYETTILAGDSFIGIWNPDLIPSINDYAIWGGSIWQNITGNVGTSLSTVLLDPTDWTLMDKENNSSPFYIELNHTVEYDFENDWVEKQRDNKGNEVGLDFAAWDNFSGANYNPCDCSDWNFSTISSSLAYFFNNKAYSIINNISSLISDNVFKGEFINNNFSGGISGNQINTLSDSTGISFMNNIGIGSVTSQSDLGVFSKHTLTSFSSNFDFSASPLVVGVPQFVGHILHDEASVIHLIALGDSLNGTNLSIGIETDDETFVGGPSGTSTIDYNSSSGVANSILNSNKTTAPFRRLRLEAFGSNITTGTINISITHTQP